MYSRVYVSEAVQVDEQLREINDRFEQLESQEIYFKPSGETGDVDQSVVRIPCSKT